MSTLSLTPAGSNMEAYSWIERSWGTSSAVDENSLPEECATMPQSMRHNHVVTGAVGPPANYWACAAATEALAL